MGNTLGILVSSEHHLGYLVKLTKAAARQNKETTIFFTGKGVLLTQEADFSELLPHASLKVCEVSFRANNLSGDVPGVGFKDFVTQAQNAEMVSECHRYIVL